MTLRFCQSMCFLYNFTVLFNIFESGYVQYHMYRAYNTVTTVETRPMYTTAGLGLKIYNNWTTIVFASWSHMSQAAQQRQGCRIRS